MMTNNGALAITRKLSNINHGLSDRVVRQIWDVLSQNQAIGSAILYGSRAKGNYRKGSDIDLTLVAASGDSLTLESIYQLDEALEELFLPYTFDLSVFTEIDNPDLVAHIQRVGVFFYQRDDDVGVA